jgi:mannose/fructose/N-acetylgalactosamine-specific phosphotransferase system component IIC
MIMEIEAKINKLERLKKALFHRMGFIALGIIIAALLNFPLIVLGFAAADFVLGVFYIRLHLKQKKLKRSKHGS